VLRTQCELSPLIGTIRRRNVFRRHGGHSAAAKNAGRRRMDGLIYLVGLVVVIMAILSFFGLR
jgi:hypothetical protein